jgi:hypothetical protein
LDELPPVKGEDRQAITLDLARHVALRARTGADGTVVEVPLRRSECNGPEVQVVLDRSHFGRALVLGFREFRCASPERPLFARDSKRIYLTATLDPKSAVLPTRSAAQAMMASVANERVPVHSDSPGPSRSSTMPSRDSSPVERNGQTDPATEESIDPVAEADALRLALSEATQRAARLVAALKQYRKERKNLQAAWSSLRGLNLGS